MVPAPLRPRRARPVTLPAAWLGIAAAAIPAWGLHRYTPKTDTHAHCGVCDCPKPI